MWKTEFMESKFSLEFSFQKVDEFTLSVYKIGWSLELLKSGLLGSQMCPEIDALTTRSSQG